MQIVRIYYDKNHFHMSSIFDNVRVVGAGAIYNQWSRKRRQYRGGTDRCDCDRSKP